MNAVDTQKTRHMIEDVLFVVVMVGGAWALGFLLGIG
jgi:hypothetical protein